MAYLNQVLENPFTGQSIRFLVTRADSSGRYLVMESGYRARGPEPPAHFHPHQEELFEVLEGEMQVRLQDQLYTLSAGQQLRIRPGEVHSMWNATGRHALLRWTVSPALRTEIMLETLFGLAKDGRTNRRGVPELLYIAVMMQDFTSEFRLAKPPRWVQQAVFTMLRPLARIIGVTTLTKRYAQFSRR